MPRGVPGKPSSRVTVPCHPKGFASLSFSFLSPDLAFDGLNRIRLVRPPTLRPSSPHSYRGSALATCISSRRSRAKVRFGRPTTASQAHPWPPRPPCALALPLASPPGFLSFFLLSDLPSSPLLLPCARRGTFENHKQRAPRLIPYQLSCLEVPDSRHPWTVLSAATMSLHTLVPTPGPALSTKSGAPSLLGGWRRRAQFSPAGLAFGCLWLGSCQ